MSYSFLAVFTVCQQLGCSTTTVLTKAHYHLRRKCDSFCYAVQRPPRRHPCSPVIKSSDLRDKPLQHPFHSNLSAITNWRLYLYPAQILDTNLHPSAPFLTLTTPHHEDSHKRRRGSPLQVGRFPIPKTHSMLTDPVPRYKAA